MPMRVSVIISTYNSPEWLTYCLWGYATQMHRDFELIVADDGSSFETALVIQRLKRETHLPIRHVWQEHQGFGKCAILNKAILAASADYLVFTDGDCIPRGDFLQKHVQLAAPGHYLSGGAVRLPMAVSRAVRPQDILDRQATEAKWLAANGLPAGKKRWTLAAGQRLAWLCDRMTTTRATFNGGNSSAWKADVLRVNGCDERMGYGGEDRELGERLNNIGIRGNQIRHRAVCVHLEHERGYIDPDMLVQNLAIRRETLRNRSTWTPYGIRKGYVSFEQYQCDAAELAAQAAPSRTAA
jgi:glycosyltransferase involved in cell wall biosynthesis